MLGTSPASIDLAEDRERWNALCHELDIPQPPGGTATTTPEALAVAGQVGYPVLLRPSYVLGGRAMEIVYDDDGVRRVMQSMTTGALAREGGVTADRPVLVDRFLEDAVEVDVDAVRDGAGEILIAGVMEHVEEAGVHSGDSACALPPQTLRDDVVDQLERHTRALAESLEVCGLINVQFAVKDGQVYVLEANPRASRTVPFVAKATGVPLAMVASRVMVGQTLADLRQEGLLRPDVVGRVPVLDHVSVKEAVLPFDRFPGVDTLLGPEMRSTGEVMGVDSTFGLAFAKSQMAAGTRLPDSGTVFLSLADRDKPAGLEVARAFSALGFSIAATLGTAGYLRSAGPGRRHPGGQGGGGGRGLRCRRAHRPGQGAAGREHAARPRSAGRRPAHPHGLGRAQGALPHHAGGGPGGRGGHRRRAVAPAPGARAAGSPPDAGGHVAVSAAPDGRRAATLATSVGSVDPSQSGADGLGDVRARHRAVRVRRAGRARRGRGQVALGRAVARQPGAAGARGRGRHAQQRRPPGSRDWRRGWPTTSRRCANPGARVVVSIWGRSVSDYARAAELVAVAASSPARARASTRSRSTSAVPNVEDRSRMFAHSAEATARVLEATACGLPRWAKLSPNVPDLVEIATGAVEGGADGLTLVNTLLGLALDTESGRPVLGAGGGGLSGGAVHPVAVRAVWECRAAFPELPIVGVGGVFSGHDAVELLLAGADAVQVGTATFRDPRAPWKVLRQLARWCDAHATTVGDIRQAVRRRVSGGRRSASGPVATARRRRRDAARHRRDNEGGQRWLTASETGWLPRSAGTGPLCAGIDPSAALLDDVGAERRRRGTALVLRRLRRGVRRRGERGQAAGRLLRAARLGRPGGAGAAHRRGDGRRPHRHRRRQAGRHRLDRGGLRRRLARRRPARWPPMP